METRNTKQKETIKVILSRPGNRLHPTINEIIKMVEKEDNSIGQATIYRQVNRLVKDNILKRIPTKEGFRYDITSFLHGHFVCQKCGRIIDLYDKNYQVLITELENKYSIKIHESNLINEGICEECNGKV